MIRERVSLHPMTRMIAAAGYYYLHEVGIG